MKSEQIKKNRELKITNRKETKPNQAKTEHDKPNQPKTKQTTSVKKKLEDQKEV